MSLACGDVIYMRIQEEMVSSEFHLGYFPTDFPISTFFIGSLGKEKFSSLGFWIIS